MGEIDVFDSKEMPQFLKGEDQVKVGHILGFGFFGWTRADKDVFVVWPKSVVDFGLGGHGGEAGDKVVDVGWVLVLDIGGDDRTGAGDIGAVRLLVY